MLVVLEKGIDYYIGGGLGLIIDVIEKEMGKEESGV